MTARRTALWIAAFLLGIAATFVLTADVKVGDANCGSALVPRDPTEISIDTGHPVDDEMRNSIIRGQCDHNIGGRRAVGAIPAVAALALAVVASRPPREKPFNGDPII